MNGTQQMPPLDLVVLQVDATASKLVAQGYSTEVAALEFSKDMNIFSEAHSILQDFIDGDMKEEVQFEHDPECEIYPEVYTAWKAAGQEDNCPTIATCPGLIQWGVGFGGKANALRAAKLSLALNIARTADQFRLATITTNYPLFGKMCTAAGIA